jgi:hypothetical protein
MCLSHLTILIELGLIICGIATPLFQALPQRAREEILRTVSLKSSLCTWIQ